MVKTMGIWVLAVLALGISVPVAAQNAANGGMLFKQRCQMCHVSQAGQKPTMAPNLSGVAGRPAASTAFAYSTALKKSGLKWDKATLDSFLAAPAAKVPGTRMFIAVSDPKQRADIIAYLTTLK